GRRASLAGAAMLGLLGGAMALTRAEGLLYALVFAGWMTIAQWRTRPAGAARLQFLHATLVTMLVACVVVMPWTIRNALRLGEANRRLAGGISEPLPRFVPVTLYGPLNLALANHDGADGAFSRAILPDRDGSGQLRLNDPDQLRFMLHGDRIAGEWIAAHPGDFARLVMKKWALYFGSLRLGWTQWDLPGGLTGLRRPVDIFVPQRPWALVFWLPALLGGAWFAGRGGARERQWLGLTLLLTGAALGVVAFFFGYARLGLLLVPLWATLGAVAVVRAARGLAGKLPARRMAALRGRSGRIAAGALVVLLLGIEVAGAIRGHRLEATGSTLTSTNRLNRDQPVSFRPLP
ncbi:MAG: hypothetical protein ABI639_09050, partial [Thermoanaerobaculia bacterium]